MSSAIAHRAWSPGSTRALLEIAAAVRGPDDLQRLLTTAAQVVAESVGSPAASVSVLRPACDDFEVLAVYGAVDGPSTSLGATVPAPHWRELLDDGTGGLHDLLVVDHPGRPARPAAPARPSRADEPLAFGETVILPLRSSRDELLGVLSLQRPTDGRPATALQRDALATIGGLLGLGIERALATARALQEEQEQAQLLELSSRLTRDLRPDQILDALCAGAQRALGFRKVVVLLAEGPERVLQPRASRGWTIGALKAIARQPLSAYARLLEPALEQEGCVLLSQEQAAARVPELLVRPWISTHGGRGPLAWQHHWLLVVLRDRGGAVTGLVWADEPQDRLLPSPARRRELRTLANHAMTALESARQLQSLHHQAEHDPLTGLHNRHAFETRLAARLDRLADDAPAALLVCDLDSFEAINDALGQDGGDDVLRRFADLLRNAAPDRDALTRLGGEEFAVVLAGVDGRAALTLAERLRLATREAFSDVPVPVTLSVGLAARDETLRDGADLVRAAFRALHAAKRLGRDRCALHDDETLSLLDTLRDTGTETSDQLAAVILLAETLDLRDGGTARHSETVGHLTEQIAQHLGWERSRVERMRVAGLLHDIGKLGVSDAILHKEGSLDPTEWEEIKRHPELGARILDHAKLHDISRWVRHHHERVDGRGYPRGWPATTSRSSRGCWRWPTRTRR